MNGDELRRDLERAKPGAEVHPGPGEFEGPLILDRPVRLVGAGPSTVLWVRTGPALVIRSPGVHLEALCIEVTEEADGIALQVEGEAAAGYPTVADVRLFGRAEGLPFGRRWRVPAIIDFGQISPDSRVERTLGIEAPGELEVRPELAGLAAAIEGMPGGRHAVRLMLDCSDLSVDSLVEGKLHIEAGGLASIIRLTGQVVTPEKVPASLSTDVQGQIAALLHTGTSPSIPRAAQAHPSLLLPVSPSSGTAIASSASPLVVRPPAARSTPVQSLDALLEAARVAEDAGDGDTAIEILNGAVSATPTSVQPRVALARLNTKFGHVDAARESWERVQALDPTYPELALHLSACYSQLSRIDEAIAVLERAVHDPQYQQRPTFFRALAVAYAKANRFAEAVWAIDRAEEIQSDPRSAALRTLWQRSIRT